MSRQLPDQQIEIRLRNAARAFPYPPTPDIAGAVWQRLVKEGAHTTTYRQRAQARRSLATITLSLLAITLVVALAVPEARSLVGTIVRTGMSTTVPATPTPVQVIQLGPTSTPGPTSQLLAAMPGSMTLEEARAKLSFPVRLPSYPSILGEPDRVFVQDLDSPTLILIWLSPTSREKASVILYEIADNGEGIKTKDDSLYMQAASVNKKEAQWVRGPYVLDSGTGQGLTYTVAQRLVGGNMLAWQENGVAFRLETTYSLPEAVHIAESLRTSP